MGERVRATGGINSAELLRRLQQCRDVQQAGNPRCRWNLGRQEYSAMKQWLIVITLFLAACGPAPRLTKTQVRACLEWSTADYLAIRNQRELFADVQRCSYSDRPECLSKLNEYLRQSDLVVRLAERNPCPQEEFHAGR